MINVIVEKVIMKKIIVKVAKMSDLSVLNLICQLLGKFLRDSPKM